MSDKQNALDNSERKLWAAMYALEYQRLSTMAAADYQNKNNGNWEEDRQLSDRLSGIAEMFADKAVTVFRHKTREGR